MLNRLVSGAVVGAWAKLDWAESVTTTESRSRPMRVPLLLPSFPSVSTWGDPDILFATWRLQSTTDYTPPVRVSLAQSRPPNRTSVTIDDANLRLQGGDWSAGARRDRTCGCRPPRVGRNAPNDYSGGTISRPPQHWGGLWIFVPHRAARIPCCNAVCYTPDLSADSPTKIWTVPRCGASRFLGARLVG